MSLPRIVLALAALLLGAQAVVLTLHGEHSLRPVLSNGFQLGIGLLFIVAAVDAARAPGATPFERRFMLLMGARYVIWAGGQGLATYYELVGRLDFEGSTAHLLFTIEDVALGVALCLDPGRSDRPLEPPLVARLLEVALIVVFWSAVYLYIRLLGAEGQGLFMTWDALVAASFYLRAMLSRSRAGHSLFGRWTPVLLLSSANHAYASHFGSEAGAAFDLVWSVDMLLWILTALTWEPARFGDWAGGRPAGDPTTRHLPLVVACFSLVLALGLLSRQPAVGLMLVGATALCVLGRHRRPRAAA